MQATPQPPAQDWSKIANKFRAQRDSAVQQHNDLLVLHELAQERIKELEAELAAKTEPAKTEPAKTG